MPKKVELQIGEVRGDREYLGFFGYSEKNGRKRAKVKTRCTLCGEEKVIFREHFIRGVGCNTCKQKINTDNLANFKRSHGLGQSRFYRLYYTMKGRCEGYGNLGNKYYHDKGIKCLWNTFEEFKNDMYESYLDHVAKFGEKNTTIDRLDNSKNYCKENCRWATIKEQKRNTTANRFYDFNGVIMCEQDIRNLTKEKRSEVRKKYTRVTSPYTSIYPPTTTPASS